MAKFVWTEETIAVEAKNHESRSKFALNGAGAYQAAIKFGILDRVCAHMKQPPTWLEKAIAKHGDRYDYSKSVHTGSKNKITITCRIHGGFELNSAAHLQGTGCQKCAWDAKKVGLSKWIEECTKVHKGKYDYSKSEYINSKSKVLVICPEHGEFWTVAHDHKSGHGCMKCKNQLQGELSSMPYSEFLSRSIAQFGDKFEFSGGYKNTSSNINIKCLDCGHVVTKRANSHLQSKGCPACVKREVAQNMLIGRDEFIRRATEKHKGKYGYSTIEYKGWSEKHIFICPTHGEFEQTASYHTRCDIGCPKCVEEYLGSISRKTTEEFIADAIDVHLDRYDYTDTVYSRDNEPVNIRCKLHGEFSQEASSHLQGRGCPACVPLFSKPEDELRSWVESLGLSTKRDRSILNGKEIDILIEEKSLGIEFNGLIWHSDAFAKSPMTLHKHKTDLAKEKGIRLIHVYEDDWRDKKDIVKNLLLNALGMNTTSFYARKCIVSEITPNVAREFLEKNHIQGYAKCWKSLALHHNGELVAVMSFSKNTSQRGIKFDEVYELSRYASVGRVVGGAGKLFMHFANNNDVKEVFSYSSNDMFTGQMYAKLGFLNAGQVRPDYKVIDKAVRRHKSNYRRSALEKRFGERFDPNQSEHENCKRLGLFRIYNSGLTRWVWKPT